MNKNHWGLVAGVCAFTLVAGWSSPARAQNSDEKMKPTEYCYVSSWDVPRPQWADMLKVQADDRAAMDKLMADGSITAYGNDATLVHQQGEATHSDWMCGPDAGKLASIVASYIVNPKQPEVYSASKHSDILVESQDYSWHPGTFTDGYLRSSYWQMKPGAPDDAVEQISRNFMVPIFEKLMASGAIHGYGIYTESVHTTNPASFWSVFIAAGPDGLNAYNKAVGDMLKQNPMGGAAFESMVDFPAHRDSLTRVVNMSEK
jgi:hypothetical protein